MRIGEELCVGDEIAGVRRNPFARRQEGSLPCLRMRLFTSITTTLRHEGSHKLQENLFLALRTRKQATSPYPLLVVVVGALVGDGCAQGVGREDAPLLWEEVENARANLARGEHFHNLALPLTRQAAHHFHLQLAEERSK